ncbi:RIPOR family member 3 [Chanos chanos]|uniref:RIPOR family member 3 n=1 Tax=Chanos chanos TaxID=29144 RepID=A0A6J2VW26_CHACN|nr:RIPOR family member 3 [Chanos chanos]XP_030636138.1 RIPOR family member 3 [Chanos chanos]
MSVKLRFECPAEGGMVQRSRSFTGFSTISGRHRSSSVRGSLRTKVFAGRSPRMSPSTRLGSSVWGQQPEQVDRIFQALRKGLKEYLEGHQLELDFLSSQQRDTKRNSRLAFFYDLEKEIRALERYVRRLEFHISKVEELYETYCIQWRLCQGAVNMKRAFSLYPSSRASRESLLELSRNHRHSLEDMSVIETELEILLGELHIKMKGLIGFARLCPGDQYEVLIKLGRQRWRIRGRIQTDDEQAWDEEEMVFLPHIHENFEIKVTEVKGLGSILVGMVTCKSADFFMARPQIMVVDITELGTIKLQLEVVWNPFDSGETKPMVSSASRQSLPSRKGSVYSWTPPNTPSFSEKYFISMMRQWQDADSPLLLRSRPMRGVSLFSYLSDCSPALTPHTYKSRSLSHISPETPSDTSPGEELLKPPLEDEADDWSADPSPSLDGNQHDSTLMLHRYSTPDILKQNRETVDEGVQSRTVTGGQEETGPVGEVLSEEKVPVQPAVSGTQMRAAALTLSTVLRELDNILENTTLTEPELKRLDQQIQRLNEILKNDLESLKNSSTETLAVEEVLGSFDFLSTDFNADEVSCMGSMSLRETGISTFQENTLRSLGLLSQDSSTAMERDGRTSRGRKSPGQQVPLSMGDHSLDQALEVHLGVCMVLLRALSRSDSDAVRKDILEELSRQTDVVEKMVKLSLGKMDKLLISDLLPTGPRSKGIRAFWEECIDGHSLFCCTADRFLSTLKKRFIHKVKAKRPGQSDAVFIQLLQQIQAGCRMVPLAQYTPDRVTVFQLQVYLSRWNLTDFGEHISQLSREVYFLSRLETPKRRRALRKLRGKRISELQPLWRTLQLLALLQVDPNPKVAQAAATCLCRASGLRAFRSKAVVYYTELLRDSDIRQQQAACLALKCLKATESADQVAELWRSADEDLRNAARETVLSFGKKGHLAFQRMDRICSELQEEAYRNLDTETTIL